MAGERITSRITSEERSTLSSYIGLGIAVVLAAAAIYFFLLSHEEKKEITTFDPNRPVPDDVTLRRRLKPEQYRVVRENGTETAFQNEFWNNERAGIYVDIITGEPLFSSVDKFDGGT
ncbi:MAG TPA: peptide-methionine (R)-S-oxide reductase, partial [Chthoniobacterales bacterium]|nr:peptide-methionine (R)-S-oxide reductase [Chthoniobacterales bacterium]